MTTQHKPSSEAGEATITNYKVGDLVRVPSGTGMQRAKIIEISADKVTINRFRARSQKWNIKYDHLSRAYFEAHAHIERRTP